MKTILLAYITILSIGLIGCSDISTEPIQENSSYSMVNSNDESTQGGEVGERGKKDSVRKDTTNKPRPTIFGDLLQKLNLTSEQKPVVERLLSEHKACVDACVKGLKDAERQIIMNARLEEAKIKELLKKGEITGDQARRELRQLREKTNAQLKELPKGKVRECVKSCDDQFIVKIKEILTPEQKTILEKWLVSRNKRGTTDDKKPEGRG